MSSERKQKILYRCRLAAFIFTCIMTFSLSLCQLIWGVTTQLYDAQIIAFDYITNVVTLFNQAYVHLDDKYITRASSLLLLTCGGILFTITVLLIVELWVVGNRFQKCRKRSVCLATWGTVLLYAVAITLCLGATGMIQINLHTNMANIQASKDLENSLQNIELYQYIFSCCGANDVSDWRLLQIPTNCCKSSKYCPKTTTGATESPTSVTDDSSLELFSSSYDDDVTTIDVAPSINYALYKGGCDEAITSYADVTVAILTLNIIFIIAMFVSWVIVRNRKNRSSGDVTATSCDVSMEGEAPSDNQTKDQQISRMIGKSKSLPNDKQLNKDTERSLAHFSKSLSDVERPANNDDLVQVKANRSIGVLQTWSSIKQSADKAKEMWATLSKNPLTMVDRTSSSSSSECLSLMSFESLDW